MLNNWHFAGLLFYQKKYQQNRTKLNKFYNQTVKPEQFTINNFMYDYSIHRKLNCCM